MLHQLCKKWRKTYSELPSSGSLDISWVSFKKKGKKKLLFIFFFFGHEMGKIMYLNCILLPDFKTNTV